MALKYESEGLWEMMGIWEERFFGRGDVFWVEEGGLGLEIYDIELYTWLVREEKGESG